MNFEPPVLTVGPMELTEEQEGQVKEGQVKEELLAVLRRLSFHDLAQVLKVVELARVLGLAILPRLPDGRLEPREGSSVTFSPRVGEVGSEPT